MNLGQSIGYMSRSELVKREHHLVVNKNATTSVSYTTKSNNIPIAGKRIFHVTDPHIETRDPHLRRYLLFDKISYIS